MSALVNDSIIAEYQLLSTSDLFDKDWYLLYCILNAEHHKLNHIDQSLVGFLSEIIGDER